MNTTYSRETSPIIVQLESYYKYYQEYCSDALKITCITCSKIAVTIYTLKDTNKLISMLNYRSNLDEKLTRNS